MKAVLNNTVKNIVIIGYGNSLRSDDAVGQKVANAIASGKLPDVTSLSVHQLTPELTAFLATAELVIFIDACLTSVCEDVQIQAIAPTNSTAIGGHTADPRSLLALTQALYNWVPNAWWVTIPGINFELGDRLSLIAERGMQIALEQIKQLIQLARLKHF